MPEQDAAATSDDADIAGRELPASEQAQPIRQGAEAGLVHESVLEQMDDGVVVVDFGGRIATFNAAAKRILNASDDDMAGRLFAEALLLQDGLDAFTQTMLDAVSSRQPTARRTIAVEVGGERRVLSMVTSLLEVVEGEQHRRVGIIGVFTDITATETLRESERRLGEQVQAQYEELQDAYRAVEDNNGMLEAALRRVRMVQGVAGVSVLAVFLLVAWLVWDAGEIEAASPPPGGSQNEVTRTTFTVVPKRLRTTVAVTGSLAPRRQVSVLSPADAVVREVLVAYGDEVQEGQALANLDLSKVQQEYRTLRASYIDAVRRERELADWENSRDVTAARRSLARTANQLEKQRHKIEETAFLLERGVIPAAEHAAAQEQYESLQADYEIAMQELEAVREAGGADAKEVSRLTFENVRDRVAALEAVIGDDALRAPVAGVVLAPPVVSRTDGPALVEGRSLIAGDMVVQIADVTMLSVGVVVDEFDIADLRVGQAATVTSDAMPEVPLAGTVLSVSSQAQSSARGRQASFAVILALEPLTDEQRHRLRLGMSVSAQIVTRNLDDALLVPLAAVSIDPSGVAAVRVQNPETGQARRVVVHTGRTTLREVEVTGGLVPGDEVLVPF